MALGGRSIYRTPRGTYKDHGPGAEVEGANNGRTNRGLLQQSYRQSRDGDSNPSALSVGRLTLKSNYLTRHNRRTRKPGWDQDRYRNRLCAHRASVTSSGNYSSTCGHSYWSGATPRGILVRPGNTSINSEIRPGNRTLYSRPNLCFVAR